MSQKRRTPQKTIESPELVQHCFQRLLQSGKRLGYDDHLDYCGIVANDTDLCTAIIWITRGIWIVANYY
jgi:hypothetical protein